MTTRRVEKVPGGVGEEVRGEHEHRCPVCRQRLDAELYELALRNLANSGAGAYIDALGERWPIVVESDRHRNPGHES